MPTDPPAGFEPVEHTADIGLRVWGRSPNELFEQAALGMITLLTDPARVRPELEREIVLEAADLEEALVSWLQELIYLFEVERFLAAEFQVAAASSSGVRARVRGERFDRTRHETRMDIKAATYHNLHIQKLRAADGTDRWETVVIFDI